MPRRSLFATWGATALSLVLSACSAGEETDLSATPRSTEEKNGDAAALAQEPSAGGMTAESNPGPGGTTPVSDAGGSAGAETNANMVKRTVNYGEALRTASLKLVEELPTLDQIKALSNATSDAKRKELYESFVDELMQDPRFAEAQIGFWENTFKTGGGGKMSFAATFAASLVVEGRAYTDLFLAESGTCPTFDGRTAQFTPQNCAGVPRAVGVLTDPGLMQQYYGNMAFRRARFVQETFACSKFPAEIGAAPKAMGAGVYTGPWKFESITGGASARVDFRDVSSVVCANCHVTMNHVAPLFGEFDQNGVHTPGRIQVMTPVTPPSNTTRQDWLPDGESYAWRLGKPVSDLRGLGEAMAADRDVARCAVGRIWNWAFSRGDIVLDMAPIPAQVTENLTTDLVQNNMKLRRTIRAVFTHEDFVKF